jgi:predicted Zn-dependent protease
MTSIPERQNGDGSATAHPKDLGESRYQEGLVAYRNGDEVTAKRLWTEAASHAVSFKAYHRLGELALKTGDLLEATTMLAAAVGLGVNQVKPRLQLAALMEQRGEPYTAAMLLTDALRINPRDSASQERLATLCEAHPWLKGQLER